MYEFLDAVITQQTSAPEAFKKFDLLATQHTEQLRKLTKQVQENRQQQDDEAVKRAVNDYDEALERYVYCSVCCVVRLGDVCSRLNTSAHRT